MSAWPGEKYADVYKYLLFEMSKLSAKILEGTIRSRQIVPRDGLLKDDRFLRGVLLKLCYL